MATDCIPQLTFRFDKLLVARFDAEHASFDGGAVLFKAVDRQLGVTEAVASCLRDRRQPGKVQHAVLELVRQRLFALACAYAPTPTATARPGWPTMPSTSGCSTAAP